MRILIDLQGAQTESRFHGIGRYSLELGLAIARSPRDHEIWLLLNGAFPDAALELRRIFAAAVPADRIVTLFPPGPVEFQTEQTNPRYVTAELLREHLVEQVDPDCILVTSLIQPDAVTSNVTPALDERTAMVVYDLIPWFSPDVYLTHPMGRTYYLHKVAEMERAGLLLAISESSREEAIDALKVAPDRVVNISTAASADFGVGPAASPVELAELGITRPFLMYTPSGYDKRKNIEGLIDAYARLPQDVRDVHQLVIASKFTAHALDLLQHHGRSAGLGPDELVFTGYVADAQLVLLYRSATLFVYPSLHEGFGLPALEAMSCGAAVIGSNRTSIPEVIGREDALFDPTSVDDMAERILRELNDPGHRAELQRHGPVQARRFSWDVTAGRALDALESRFGAERQTTARAGEAPDRNGIVRTIHARLDPGFRTSHAREIAQAIALTAGSRPGPPAVLVDITTAPTWRPDADLASAPNVRFVRAAGDSTHLPLILVPHDPQAPEAQSVRADVRTGDVLLVTDAAALVTAPGQAAARAVHLVGGRLAVLLDSASAIGDAMRLLMPQDLGILCADASIFAIAERVARPHGISVTRIDGPDAQTASLRHTLDALSASG